MTRKAHVYIGAGTAVIVAGCVAAWSAAGGFDHRLAVRLDDTTFAHPGWHRFWLDVSDALGPTSWRITAAVVVVVLLLRRRFGAASSLALTLVGAALLSSTVKAAVDRPRPHVAHAFARAAGASFPSGHALTAAAAATALGCVLLSAPRPRRTRTDGPAIAGAVALVVLVSLSRLALAVHYLSDVVGGVLIGVGWAWVAYRITHRRHVSR